MQVNFYLKAFDEIYKIYTYASFGERTEVENEIMNMYNTEKTGVYTLLHRSEFINSHTLRQTFSHFCNFILKNALCFLQLLSKIHQF